MTEAELQLQARLNAMEYLIGVAHSFARVNAKHNVEQELHKIIVENLRTQSLYVGHEPTMSDMASDEVVRNAERILKGVEALVGQALEVVVVAHSPIKSPDRPFHQRTAHLSSDGT
jgi:hypothetical protein